MNKITIIGNLTNDPQLRTTASGFNVCSFTVAVKKRQKGDSQAADFFRVSAWRQLGDTCQKFLAKGRKVAVVGEVSVSTYTTQNGETRANLEVTAQDVEFLSPRSEQPEMPYQAANTGNYHSEAGYEEVETEDLPF